MDKNIVAQFFIVEPRNEAAPNFEIVLQTALSLGAAPGNREIALSGDGTMVRLERLAAVGDWWEGEIVRIQRDNIPPEARPEGLFPSRAQSQSHSAVFRYNPNLRLLVSQINSTNMTVSRFFRYLRRVDDSARYDARPIPNSEIWERYGRMKPTRFSVTLASITNPALVEGPVGAIVNSSSRLHEITHAPVVQISVRAGGNPEGLEKSVIAQMIEGLSGINDQGFEVTSLSVSAEDEEDQASEILNFIDDILREKDEIDLNGLDSQASFNIRMDFVRTCFYKHMDYIVEHHVPA